MLTTLASDGKSRSLQGLLPRDVRLQAAALGLSALVWSLMFLFPGTSVRVRTVPVELTPVAPSRQASAIIQVSGEHKKRWWRLTAGAHAGTQGSAYRKISLVRVAASRPPEVKYTR